MRTVLAILALLGAVNALAAERKPVREIDLNKLTSETQVVSSSNDALDLIWWIPPEFWQATLSQDPSIPDAQVQEFIRVLEPYSVMAVVQADITPFGAFNFYDEATVAKGLAIEYVAASGKTTPVPHDVVSDADLDLILNQMRPILAAAMGNLGQNFYFFALPDRDGERRTVSPYENGSLRTRLASRPSDEVLAIEFPLDALMVPRMCPNGKPAHVSWNYCPWGGKKL